MRQYLLAHDLGTSGNKATLYSLDGSLVKSTVGSYGLHTLPNGGAEQLADDWWQAVCTTTRDLISCVPDGEIVAVSFSGQMSGCLCVDEEGNPLHPALIWADMRSGSQAAALRKNISDSDFYRTTGHRLSSSYSVTKLMWLRDHAPEVYQKTFRMLNAKDYILLKLTGNFVTEPSDASSTGMLDLDSLRWSDKILDAAELDRTKLPDILRSVDLGGTVTKDAAHATGLKEGTPVICGGGDGCCAAIGTGIVREGIANCCLGTSSWISLASSTPIYSNDRTTFTFAHIVPGQYLPCGTMQTGGGSWGWAVKNLCKEERAYEIAEQEATAAPAGANGVLFLPYLMGERSPRWNEHAKGSFLGLRMEHTRGDMLRAVLEGVGYNLDLILNTFRSSGASIDDLILVGGGARSNLWQQILCDIFGVPVRIPLDLEEATSMGAAITAGVGIGAFESFAAVDSFIQVVQQRNPRNVPIYAEKKQLFETAYRALEPVFEVL